MSIFKWPTCFVFVTSCIILAGCAGQKVVSVSEKDDAKVDGIRYYESAPFLLVYTDGNGNLTSKLLYLPDTNRMKAIDPYAFCASNNTTLTFSNGMLTTNTAVVDETAVPVAAIKAIKTVVSAAAKGIFDVQRGALPGDREVPPPALYRIVVEESGEIVLKGGYALGKDGETGKNIRIVVTSVPKQSK